MKVIAIVTARSGSQGIPGKNLIKIDGETLVYKAVDTTIKAGIKNVYLSTDSEIMANEGIIAGAKVPELRPKDLATSASKSIEAVKHMLECSDDEYDALLVIQPSSPLRTPEDLKKMMEILEDNFDAFDGVASVTKIIEPHPYKMTWLNSDMSLDPVIINRPVERARQILKPAYSYNGIGYLVKKKTLFKENKIIPSKVYGYEVPYERSINLDSKWDLLMLKAMLADHEVSNIQGE